MASAGAINIFDNVKALKDEISQNWPGDLFAHNDSIKIDRWEVAYNILAWPLSVREPGSTITHDYYLVQVEGSTGFLSGNSSWSLAAHELMAYPVPVSSHIDPTGPRIFGMLLPTFDYGGAELVDTSPPSTVGQTSYTTGISTTIGGSVGMMGEMPTASASTSVTTSHSETRSISDLTITNRSRLSGKPPLDAWWTFEVAPGSPVAQGDCPIVVEFLYCVPHGAPVFAFKLYWSVYLAGGDPEELLALPDARKADGAGIMQVITGYPDNPTVFLRDKARLSYNKIVTLSAPPAPAPR